MTTTTWKSGTAGDWSTASDWDTNAIPGAGDDATIDASGTYIVSVATAEATHALTLNAPDATLDIRNGLTIGTTLAATAGTLQLDSGGLLNGGTVIAGGATQDFTGGTLSGVTWQGPLTVSGTNESVSAINGLTLTGTGGTGPGTLSLTGTNALFSLTNALNLGGTSGTPARINITGQGATLHTSGTTTLDNATLTIGNIAGAVAGDADGLIIDGNPTLTLGGKLNLIDSGTGTATVAYPSFWNSAGTLISDGTMTAGASGATLLVYTVPGYGGAFTFTNDGSLAASNGGTLAIQPNIFNDNGIISVGANSAVLLGGAKGVFGTAAAIGIAAGGTMHLQSSYSIAGTLAPTGAGTFELDNTGTLNIGTVVAGGAAMLFAGGTLSGVTYEGPLVLGGTNASVTAINGLALTGAGGTGAGEIDLTGTNAVMTLGNGATLSGSPATPATIAITGQGATLYAQGTATIDNTAVTIGNVGGGATGLTDALFLQGPGTMTLGSGFNLADAGTGTISVGMQPTYYNQPGTILSSGTLTASAPAATLLIPHAGGPGGDTFSFLNDGRLAASNGGTLTMQADTFTDNGIIAVGTSSTAQLYGTGMFGTAASVGIGAGGVVRMFGNYSIGGTLAPNGAGTFELESSGTLNVGTLAAGGAAIGFAGGTLSGVTFEGPLVLGGTNAALTAINGLTLTGSGGTGPGTIDLSGTNAVLNVVNGFTSGGSSGTPATIGISGQGATLYTSGTTTLDNAALTLGNAGGAIAGHANSLVLSGPSTLTLGAGFSLADAGTGTIGVDFSPTYYSQAGAIINQGTMTAGAAGATLLVQRIPAYGGDSLTFTNDGLLSASNGGTLSLLADSFIDNGAITVGVSSVALLNGTATYGTAAALGIGAGGVARLLGSYSIAGSLAPTGAGSFELDSGGTLNVGTLVAGGAAMVFAGGTLSGVTYQGPLVLDGAGASATAVNGLALVGAGGTGPGTLDLTGTNAAFSLVNGFSSGGSAGTLASIDVTGHGAILNTSGTTTLDNALLTLGNAGGAVSGGANALNVQGPSTLTLGSGLNLVDAGTGTVGVNFQPTYYNQAAAIINNGTMTAGVAGTTLLVQRIPAYGGNSLSFTNNAQLVASNGGTLTIQPDSFTDNGTITVGTSSVAQLYGTGLFGTAAAIGIGAGGVARLLGSYSIEGTLAPTGAGTFELDNTGTLNAGTVAAGGAPLLFAGGTLSGVTFEGPMVLAGTGASATAINGLSLTGASGTGPGTLALTGTNAAMFLSNSFSSGGSSKAPAEIDITGHGATLYTSGTTTLDNATVTIGNAAGGVAGSADSLLAQGSSTLTLGSGLNLIEAGAGTVNVGFLPSYYNQSATIDNSGTMTAGVAGATLIVQRIPAYSGDSLAVLNDGLLAAANGGTLSIQPDNFISNGTIEIGANSTGLIAVPGGFVNQGVLDVAAGATATVSGPLISGVGSLAIGSGGDLILNASSVVSTQTVVFASTGTAGPVSTLQLANPATFSGTIDAFTTPGDTLKLVGQTVTGASINGAALTVTLAAGAPMTFNLADTPASTLLMASGDSVSVAVGPTIAGVVAGQTLTDVTTIHPFANVTIGDVAAGQTETVTVTLSAAANGALSGLAGSYNPSTGVYTVVGNTDAVTAALKGLVFTPTAHEAAPGQTVTTTFTINVVDTATVSATDKTSTALATATSAPRTLSWSGAKDTAFANSLNWIDTTFKHSPALWAPNNTDTVAFTAAGGTISGTGSVAAIDVEGTGRWTVTDAAAMTSINGITVGQSGSGDLLIDGGAGIFGLDAIDTVNGTSGAGAEVTVDGAGSTWRSNGELIAGVGGSGEVNLTNGASLSAAATASLPAMVLGSATGGMGSLDVSASQATLTGELDIGQAGRGVLTVESQGTLLTGGASVAPSQGFDLGRSAGASGQATVTGNKSLLSNTGAFIVGDAGVGGLSIQSGGTIITTPGTVGGLAGMVIGNTAGAAGSSVNVSGSGSRLEVTGTLDVGMAGSGAIQIDGGATVTAGSLDAGKSAAAVGQIGVSGAGTELLVTGAATVADDGTGVMSVLNGADFTASDLTVGALGDSSGALVVSGSGSTVHLSGALNIGTSLGTGDLTVGPGAAVHASVLNLQGQVVLEGGLLDPTVSVINQGQTAGGFGTLAAGMIVDEGVIQAGGSKPSQKLLLVQGTVLGGGTLSKNGTVQPSVAAGLLQINAGGTMELTGPVLNNSTTFNDVLTPTGTYSVSNSVIDVTFSDGAGVLLLDDIAGFGGTITAFKAGDQFVIPGGTLSNVGISNNNTLTFSDSGANAGAGGVDQIIFGAAINAGQFNIINGDTMQTVACFTAGTRIETENGPVRVESLAVGDRVVTAGGRVEPIVWIGQRAVNCARHPAPETVWPVRVTAGAFGANVPARDVYLSPDHAVFVDGVLVPVKLLINGTSIAQVKRERVTYYHVELPRHDVILAEELTVESYLDLGDRTNFRQSETIRLFPDFAARLAPDTALIWETRGAAPLVTSGPELAAVRKAVAENAIRLAA